MEFPGNWDYNGLIHIFFDHVDANKEWDHLKSKEFVFLLIYKQLLFQCHEDDLCSNNYSSVIFF